MLAPIRALTAVLGRLAVVTTLLVLFSVCHPFAPARIDQATGRVASR